MTIALSKSLILLGNGTYYSAFYPNVNFFCFSVINVRCIIL